MFNQLYCYRVFFRFPNTSFVVYTENVESTEMQCQIADLTHSLE